MNEVINGEIAKYEATHGKIDPALHQWLSATVGVIVNNAIGQTLQTGAAEAVYGTKWNDLAFQKQPLKIVYKRPWVSEDGNHTIAGHLYISDGVTTLGVTPDLSNKWENYVEEKTNGNYIDQLIESGDALVVATVSVEHAEQAIRMINDSLHKNTFSAGTGRYNFNVPRTYLKGGTCITYGEDILKMLKEAEIPIQERIPLNMLLPFESTGNKVSYAIDGWNQWWNQWWNQLKNQFGNGR